jgi:hypothetical protein
MLYFLRMHESMDTIEPVVLRIQQVIDIPTTAMHGAIIRMLQDTKVPYVLATQMSSVQDYGVMTSEFVFNRVGVAELASGRVI